MPCEIHSPSLISAHPDLQGLDRRFVGGFTGESKSRISLSSKAVAFLYRGEVYSDSMARYVKTG